MLYLSGRAFFVNVGFECIGMAAEEKRVSSADGGISHQARHEDRVAVPIEEYKMY
jgi:hypothetical protein